MAPIHDTDIAETRFTQSKWDHYELWEKIEHRLRRRKWLWIAATVAVFLLISSIPILLDRWPKWQALTLSRQLAQEINRIKREASVEHQAFRIRFGGDGKLSYVVERSKSCSDTANEVIRTGSLDSSGERFTLLSSEAARQEGLPGLIESFCYDYLSGSDAVLRGDSLVGFGIVSVKDLTAKRTDRISILLLKGTSAELSFD